MNDDNQILTLLTDFGLSDVYVGVMKGVIAQINPKLKMIDLTHQIPRHDVAAGRFCLMNAVPYFTPGTVHLAVVDPGVGTQRRAIALKFPHGYLVGPDNGLFSGVLDQFSERQNTPLSLPHPDPSTPLLTAVELTNSQYWRSPQPSSTFHGRDIFAAVAAHLASGVPLEYLGTPLDPESLVKLSLPSCQKTPRGIEGCIQYIDQFGNLITNIPANWVQGKNWFLALNSANLEKLENHKKKKKLKKNKAKKKLKKIKLFPKNMLEIDHSISRLISSGTTYGDVQQGHLVAIAGSHGWVEIACNGGNAQVQLGLDWGDQVQVLL